MVPFKYQYQGQVADSFAELYIHNCKARYRIQPEKHIVFSIHPEMVQGAENKIIWSQVHNPGEYIQPLALIQALGEGIEKAISLPQGWLPRYEAKETVAEIDLRGRFIMMACDIEWTLLHIMMYCAPDPMNQSRRFNSREMQMQNKINCTIADLKKYKPDYYAEFHNELGALQEFKEIRNDLAHKKLIFDDSTFRNFKFLFIQDNDEGSDALYYKEYTIEYFKKMLQTYIDLNFTLAQLAERLKNEYEFNTEK